MVLRVIVDTANDDSLNTLCNRYRKKEYNKSLAIENTNNSKLEEAHHDGLNELLMVDVMEYVLSIDVCIAKHRYSSKIVALMEVSGDEFQNFKPYCLYL